jgi:cytidine deaminase
MVGVLSAAAWATRRHSRLIGETAVGCAVLADDETIYTGCNVEHRFRSHDIHAETAALAAMVGSGKSRRATAVFIVAKRELFTPCGACLDWIFELGGPGCLVLTQKAETEAPRRYTASELMPHYPY